MKTIWYESIEDILLNVEDPNTWGTIWEVPGVSSPKINAGVSVYNVEADWWIAWWSTNVSWSANDYDTVAWWSWNIYLPDWTSLSVSSWNTGNMSGMTYIYYDKDLWSVQTTTSASASVWENKILLCVAKPTSSWKDAEFQAFWTNAQSTFITADNIAANTITGNEIYANSITSSEIATWAVTASKIDVSELSAIVAKLGDVYVWDKDNWSAIRIYPYSSSVGRIDFYYNGSVIGYIRWQSASWLWWVLYINWNYIYFNWTAYCGGKLRIPVWTDLY